MPASWGWVSLRGPWELTKMLLSIGLLTVLATPTETVRPHGAAHPHVRTGPMMRRRPHRAGLRAQVAVAWLVSLSVHSAVLAALGGWSLPGQSAWHWLAVSPGQAAIALVASPAAEVVVGESAPPPPGAWPARAESPPAAAVDIVLPAETVIRWEGPQAPTVKPTEARLMELSSEPSTVAVPARSSWRGRVETAPALPDNSAAAHRPRRGDGRRNAELPPSTADTLPSRASLAAEGAEEQVPTIRHNPAPEYPAAALQARQTGRVVLLVGVQPSGTVAWAKLFTSSGLRVLDQAALDVIHRWRFSPADGATTIREIRVPFRFVLDE